MQTPNPQQILQNAELIYDAPTIAKAIAHMAVQLNQDYAVRNPVVLCVMGGAVVFTGQLLPQLTFLLEFDYVQATRYQNETAGHALTWIVKPKALVKGRNVLILDDILDEGITLKAIVEECKALGAAEVKTAVLIEKTLDRPKPIEADYVGLTVPNRYIFGFGMDIYGWWRNLSGIFAKK